eukprot:30935-Pelagococcus_subviridis.AAC.8
MTRGQNTRSRIAARRREGGASSKGGRVKLNDARGRAENGSPTARRVGRARSRRADASTTALDAAWTSARVAKTARAAETRNRASIRSERRGTTTTRGRSLKEVAGTRASRTREVGFDGGFRLRVRVLPHERRERLDIAS